MHQIVFSEYSIQENPNVIESALNADAKREGDYHTGLNKPIQWMDKTFASYDDARDFIEEHYCRGDYEQVAVKYREALKPSAKMRHLREQLIAARQRWNQLNSKNYFKSLSVQFVSCPSCGSKLNREKMETRSKFACAVCGADMRPKTTLDRIEAALERCQKIEKEIKEEERRMTSSKKVAVKWLVKTEYHC